MTVEAATEATAAAAAGSLSKDANPDTKTTEETTEETTEITASVREENVEESDRVKKAANGLFATGDFDAALARYSESLEFLADTRKERSLIYGNMAACYLKLGKCAQAVEKCNEALEIDPDYTKAILRRAQANERIGTYTSMSAALEDYSSLVKKDPKSIEAQNALIRLPPRIATRQTQEKEEMMNKLKEMGNSVLGKFGLSTDNFQMVPNGQGGYSMNFRK